MNCQNSLGHEDCGLVFLTIEHEGHQAAPNAWERSKNKVYRRKIERQQGKTPVVKQFTFKKGRK